MNVDEFYDIFRQTVGSIRGAMGVLLWTWSWYSNMSTDLYRQAVLTYVALAWLLLVLWVHGLLWVNQRFVDGWTKFRIDPKTDTIVVTGGSHGLGLLLLAHFSADGFRTVNLDVSSPEFPVAHSQYIECDVSNEASVSGAFEKLDSASVLINCAGTVNGSLGPLESLDSAAIAKVAQTNYFGSIWTTRAFLKGNAKMIVGISSTTALVAPAFTSIYASSKAAVRAFYTSLRYELSRTRVLCVVPGQLDTAMFRDIETPSEFWAPVMSSAELAMRIYEAVLRGQQGELSAPLYARLLPFILVLPQSLVDLARRVMGVDRAARAAHLNNSY